MTDATKQLRADLGIDQPKPRKPKPLNFPARFQLVTTNEMYAAIIERGGSKYLRALVEKDMKREKRASKKQFNSKGTDF